MTEHGSVVHPRPSPVPRPAPDDALVGSLMTLGAALAPSAAARDRMRANVTGATTVLPAVAVGPAAPTTTRVDELAPRRAGRGARGRFLVAAAAAVCLVVALSALSLLLSRDALPGDALYAVKRAAESTRTDLTFGDADRGLRQLQTAAQRIDELTALAARGDDLSGGDTVDTLMTSFDTDAETGSSLLTTAGVAGDTTVLPALTTWAQAQSTQLGTLAAALPAGARGPVVRSGALVGQVLARSQALQSRLGCTSITGGSSDALGPQPAAEACTAVGGAPGPTPGTVTTTPAPTAPGAGAAASTAAGAVGGGSAGSTRSGSASTGGAGATGTGAGAARTATPPPSATAVPAPTGSGGAPSAAGSTAPAPTTTRLPPTFTVPVPLPLPPITLPTILPGIPPVTLGG